MEKLKEKLLTFLDVIALFLASGFVWGSLIFGAVNICFGYDFSLWKEILLGGIFQTSLFIIRKTFSV